MREPIKTLTLTDDAPVVVLAELPGDLQVSGSESMAVSILADDDHGISLELDAEGRVQVRAGPRRTRRRTHPGYRRPTGHR